MQRIGTNQAAALAEALRQLEKDPDEDDSVPPSPNGGPSEDAHTDVEDGLPDLPLSDRHDGDHDHDDDDDDSAGLESPVPVAGPLTQPAAHPDEPRIEPTDPNCVMDASGDNFRGGTLSMIVAWIIFRETVDANGDHFLQCYRYYYATPMQLLDCMKTMYDTFVYNQSKKRLLLFLHRWFLLRYRWDFLTKDRSVYKAFLAFLGSDTVMLCNHQTANAIKLDILKKVAADKRDRKAAKLAASSRKGRKRSLSFDVYTSSVKQRRTKLMSFNQYSSKLMAEQLTLIGHQLYCDVTADELLDRRNRANANNFRAIVTHWNDVVKWVTIAIVHAQRKRMTAIKKFIKVAERLYKLHNFNTLAAVVSALQTATVRSQPEWSKLPRKYEQRLLKFEAVFEPAGNHRAYRECLLNVSSTATVCPYFALHLRTLTYIHDGNPDDLGNGHINYKKIQLLGALVSKIKAQQSSQYAIQPLTPIYEYFSHLHDFLCEDAAVPIPLNGSPAPADASAAVAPQEGASAGAAKSPKHSSEGKWKKKKSSKSSPERSTVNPLMRSPVAPPGAPDPSPSPRKRARPAPSSRRRPRAAARPSEGEAPNEEGHDAPDALVSDSPGVTDAEVASARKHSDPMLWDESRVSQWLHTSGLGEYEEHFMSQSIGGAELLELRDGDLVTIGVHKLGHRKKLMKLIKELYQSEESSVPAASYVVPEYYDGGFTSDGSVTTAYDSQSYYVNRFDGSVSPRGGAQHLSPPSGRPLIHQSSSEMGHDWRSNGTVPTFVHYSPVSPISPRGMARIDDWPPPGVVSPRSHVVDDLGAEERPRRPPPDLMSSEEGSDDGSPSAKRDPYIWVKGYYVKSKGDDPEVRVLRVRKDISVNGLTSKFRSEFGRKVVVKFRDYEGDLITLTKKADLRYAFMHAEGGVVKFSLARK